MLKELQNNLIEVFNGENMENTNAIFFTGLEVNLDMNKDFFENVKEFSFKYRNFTEYKFNYFAVYKMYCTNEESLVFNIVRLTDSEINRIHNELKYSEYLKKINIDLTKYDLVGFYEELGNKDIIHEDENYIISEDCYEDEYVRQDCLYIHEREPESEGYDYKRWYENKVAEIETQKVIKKIGPGLKTIEEEKLKKFFIETPYITGEKIEVKSFYESSKEEFAKEITLETNLWENCIDEEGGIEEEVVDTIVGNLDFGKNYYFQRGQEQPCEEKENPDFNIEDRIICLKEKKNYQTMRRESESNYNYCYTLITYNI